MLWSSEEEDALSIDTEGIKEWRAIVTLIVFVLTSKFDINVLWPWKLPIYVPVSWCDAALDWSSWLRISAPRQQNNGTIQPPTIGITDVSLGDLASKPPIATSLKLPCPSSSSGGDSNHANTKKPEGNQAAKPRFKKFDFPMNFVTVPIIADLFLLAIGAIGGKEVRQGTLSANKISPLDIMLFFITLAYIAISIDASGLIRFLAFKVLEIGRGDGRRLFLYLYAFFFALTTCIGNDPVILSGTAFLAYMTRVAKDMDPRAWIFSQFAVANIGSAILVSSNPTNLVLAGAFEIKFIHYTANMVVPAVITAAVLLPFLMYFVFHDDTDGKWIPRKIDLYELPSSLKKLTPMNPNMPVAPPRENASSVEDQADKEDKKLRMREEVLNPFLDSKSAVVGSIIMAITLAAVLALNAASTTTQQHPVFFVTLPAAFLMFCWDLGFGWVTRKATQQTAKEGAEQRWQALMEQQGCPDSPNRTDQTTPSLEISMVTVAPHEAEAMSIHNVNLMADEKALSSSDFGGHDKSRPTLIASLRELLWYLRKTFPTVMAVFSHLPLALVPFAFAMFILVQALVSKNWVATFAYGWKHWVDKTGVVGAISGMGFLSVILCNFAGTNIGTTILLSRVIQTWKEIHVQNGSALEDRIFWATIYSMAIGVNYGAFSSAFSASLAGLLWKNILEKKDIKVGSLKFARVNLPIISVSMVVGLSVLIAQVYITGDGTVH